MFTFLILLFKLHSIDLLKLIRPYVFVWLALVCFLFKIPCFSLRLYTVIKLVAHKGQKDKFNLGGLTIVNGHSKLEGIL